MSKRAGERAGRAAHMRREFARTQFANRVVLMAKILTVALSKTRRWCSRVESPQQSIGGRGSRPLLLRRSLARPRGVLLGWGFRFGLHGFANASVGQFSGPVYRPTIWGDLEFHVHSRIVASRRILGFGACWDRTTSIMAGRADWPTPVGDTPYATGVLSAVTIARSSGPILARTVTGRGHGFHLAWTLRSPRHRRHIRFRAGVV